MSRATASPRRSRAPCRGRGRASVSKGDDLLAGHDRQPTRAPHLIPIWGSWIDGRWYVEGGPTRWQRNLRENPQLAIKVEFGDEVVIVEGTARNWSRRPNRCRATILSGYAKYKAAGRYEASASHWAQGGLWELTPVKAFAWSVFPTDMTALPHSRRQ